ncbi:porin family protein [Winogradskyella sp.]|jgi:hypothetical protein|uniref:porin family protein n=1 Tax=Winogradskyella sp. TaxID=1883156 RepID=UPI0025DB1487|nr:porin family protein [Winogradskyella sp.]MCT4630107.1 PorT family protein [Winogradskyella sp.]
MNKTTLKTVLLSAFILAGIFMSNAQSDSNFSFGAKGGANLSKFNSSNTKNRIGFVTGLFTEYQFSKQFAIRSEVLFSNQGTEIKQGAKKIKLNYINLTPAIAKFYPIKNFSLEAGPYLGYLLNKKGGALKKSDYRKLDYGASLGLAYRISDDLEIGTRYHLGLRDITKVSGEVKNRSIIATLSVYF